MNIGGDATKQVDHLRAAMSLEADGYVTLFRMRMTPPGEAETVFRFTPYKSVAWNGFTYESYGCGLTDYKKESSGESSRPKFTLFNPNGFFSRYVHRRWADNAEVVRYRVLKEHLDAGINSYLKNTWRVGKVLTLSRTIVSFELREALDGQFFLMPARAYFPPEFPSVSL